MKPWLIALIVLIALVVAWLAWGGLAPGIAVQAAAVKMGPIQEFVDEQAITRLPQTYLITMPFAGRIEPIKLQEGMAVKEGQVVARIVPRDLELAVQQAQAAVERLKASIKENAHVKVERTAYDQAQKFVDSTAATVKAAKEQVASALAKSDYADRHYARLMELFQKRVENRENLDAAELQKLQSGYELNQNRLIYTAMLAMQAATDLTPMMILQYIERKGLTGLALEQQKAEAEAHLQQVLQDQQRGTMTSPVSGVILQRTTSNERFQPAGTTLLEIGRLEDLEVEADVLSLDVVAVKVGHAVEIYGPAIGRPAARGAVSRIFPAGFTKVSSLGVEQQRVKVIVRFQKEDLDRLLSERHLGVGYRVRVRILTAEKPQALVVPRSALFRAADGTWQLYAIRRGRARIQSVGVGLMNDESVEIIDGLTEGEQVVLAPESSLADGEKVSPQGGTR